jgi:hypothetical protein
MLVLHAKYNVQTGVVRVNGLGLRLCVSVNI